MLLQTFDESNAESDRSIRLRPNATYALHCVQLVSSVPTLDKTRFKQTFASAIF